MAVSSIIIIIMMIIMMMIIIIIIIIMPAVIGGIIEPNESALDAARRELLVSPTSTLPCVTMPCLHSCMCAHMRGCTCAHVHTHTHMCVCAAHTRTCVQTCGFVS